MFQALKKYDPLQDDPKVPVSLLHRCASLLLSGVAHSMYGFDRTEKAMLKGRLERLSEELASEIEEQELLETIEKITRVFDIYNQHCEQHVTSAAAEARHTIKLLLEILSKKEFAIETVSVLQASRELLDEARTSEDIRVIRKKLERYLWRQGDANEPERKPDELDAGVARSHPYLVESSTGLRGRAAAMDCIAVAIRQRRLSYGVIIRLDCLPAIQNRYGDDAAQDFLNAVSHSLVQALQGTDVLFHWGKNCLFAVLNRNLSPESMSHEVHRLAQIKRELRIEVDGRSVMFAVPTSTEFFPISSSSDLQFAVEKIDRFAATEY